MTHDCIPGEGRLHKDMEARRVLIISLSILAGLAAGAIIGLYFLISS